MHFWVVRGHDTSLKLKRNIQKELLNMYERELGPHMKNGFEFKFKTQIYFSHVAIIIIIIIILLVLHFHLTTFSISD